MTYQVTRTNLRLGDIDSYSSVFLSTKEEADKLAEIWAMDEFEFVVKHNPMWRIDQWYDESWKVYEEENPKWAYEFTVAEINIEVYERAVDTSVYKHIEKKKLKHK